MTILLILLSNCCFLSLTHLNVDEDTVVSLVQHFVAFSVQWELKGDLSLASWDFSCLRHLDVTADQLDGLRHEVRK